jgi:hypothetical protein
MVQCTCTYEINEEKHKLVHTINRSLDRESNPRPLAYGKTASIITGNNEFIKMHTKCTTGTYQ